MYVRLYSDAITHPNLLLFFAQLVQGSDFLRPDLVSLLIYPFGYTLFMNVVRQLRQHAGVTQQELARKAGTSQSTIAAYETGAKSPTLRTLERLAGALDLKIRLAVNPALTREDQRSLAYHEAVAEKLLRNPERTTAHARLNLEVLQGLHPHARKLLNRWDTWLRLPPTKLAELIVTGDEVACDMRQVSPFAGVLSPAERARVLRRFRKDQAG